MNAISIAPLGDISAGVLASMEQRLWLTFGFDVRREAPAGEPDFAIDPQRGQYSAVLVLRRLLERAPAGDARLLGVTTKDLFIPMLSFVLGQAQLNGPAAVISLARLHQEFYGLPPDPDLLAARAVKEAVHEIGHTFGLIHCTNTLCPMSLSNSIRQVDVKGAELCSSCSTMLAEHTRHMRTPGVLSSGTGSRK